MELLEQGAQLQRLGLAVVRHDRRGAVAVAVDLPADDGRRLRAALATRTLLAALAPWPLLAGAARARDQLPAFAWTKPRIIGARDKAGAPEGHDVEERIFLALAIGAHDL